MATDYSSLIATMVPQWQTLYNKAVAGDMNSGPWGQIKNSMIASGTQRLNSAATGAGMNAVNNAMMRGVTSPEALAQLQNTAQRDYNLQKGDLVNQAIQTVGSQMNPGNLMQIGQNFLSPMLNWEQIKTSRAAQANAANNADRSYQLQLLSMLMGLGNNSNSNNQGLMSMGAGGGSGSGGFWDTLGTIGGTASGYGLGQLVKG